MFKRVFGAAFAAGILTGLLSSGIHQFTTTPILLEAEKYEQGDHDHGQAFAPNLLNKSGLSNQPVLETAGFSNDIPFKIYKAHSDAAPDGGEEAWAPEDGIERTLYTVGSEIVFGVAFALMLTAAFTVHGVPVDGRRGVLWGIGGFAVFTLAPALGLPPEVPGSMAADLGGRQLWWLGCAAATGVGLLLLVFGNRLPLIILGLLIIAAPHVVGAPQPEHFGGTAPPELAGHFAAASIVTKAIFWAMLGWFSGTFYKKLGEA